MTKEILETKCCNLQLDRHIFSTGERTRIMGVLNVTPDSFSDGGKYLDPHRAVEAARLMVSEGADIIDIGGESSRPGSERITLEEELARVIPVVRLLKDSCNVPISVDTCKSGVAKAVLAEGVALINDITALRGDPCMAGTIAGFNAGVILMHMKGVPETMQEDANYGNIIQEINTYLSGSVDIAIEAGIDPEKIIIDPGIGFGKTVEQNVLILRKLSRFRLMGKPVLVGTSRKSFIGSITGKDVGSRTLGTAASVSAAILNGADIVRVHDIADMKDVVSVTDAIRGTGL